MPTTNPNPDDIDDDLDLPDDGGGGDSLVRLPRRDIRALEKQGKRAAELAAQNEALQRDLAFARAGIDTSTDEGAFFARGYAGELDTDAIKASASRFNILAPGSVGTGTPDNPAPTAADVQLAPGEADLTAHRQALAQGAAGDVGVDVDPYDEALRIGQDILDKGGKFEQGMGTAINSVVNAAMRGDTRTIIRRDSPQAAGG